MVSGGNMDLFSSLMDKLYQKRKGELEETLKLHRPEVEKLPEILKLRIEALRELDPSNDAALELSSLVANELLEKLPGKTEKIDKDLYKDTHKKYGIYAGDDVNPMLACELFFAYKKDQEKGVIDSKGRIIGDAAQSQVMGVFHNSERSGVPHDAAKTMEKAKKLQKNRSASLDLTKTSREKM